MLKQRLLGLSGLDNSFYLCTKHRRMAGWKEKTQYDYEDEVEVLDSYDETCSLVVWNDEVNTFEWVIETLVEVCSHTSEQAEQCAMIIHTQGKYAVKHGGYEILKPMCEQITDRGIGATIEVLSAS